jgi:transposase-like protein
VVFRCLSTSYDQKKCPKCYSRHIKLNGKNSQWKQKYKCKCCEYCFVKKYQKQPKIKSKKTYEGYLKEWYSYRQLSKQTKHTKKTLQRCIRKLFDTSHITDIDIIYENVKYVMIDWTYIDDICVIIYYEYKLKKILKIRITNEESLDAITYDLEELRDLNWYNIQSFTIDWWIQIIWAIRKVYPNATTQRCLVHINRQIRNYIWRNTINECGKELLLITTFKVIRDREKFNKLFDDWLEKWNVYLNERSYWDNGCKRKRWYTHRKLRQSRSHIVNARLNMFQNKINMNIVDNTNELEWLISLLKTQIHNHRWMKKERLKNFIIQRCYNRN